MTPPTAPKQPTDRKRPTTQRKHTRGTEDKRRDALEQGIKITLEDETWTVRLGDISSTIARDLRRQSGMSVNQLLEEITTRPDVDVIATFVWLARRIAGEENLPLDDVVVNYNQLLDERFDVELPDAVDKEAKGAPEA